MITFCKTCDNPLQGNAAFCSKCGAPVADMPAPVGDHPTAAEEPIALPIAGPAESPSYDEAIAATHISPPPASAPSPLPEDSAAEGGLNWLLIGGALGTLLVIGLLYFFLFVADDVGSSSSGDPVAAASEEITGEEQKLFTMTEANIRDKPTTTGSAILGKLPRGSAVSGKMVAGVNDPSGRWLQLSDGKGFVSAVNLMDAQPPELTQVLKDKIWTTDAVVEVWKGPDSSSELLDRVSEGTKLTLSGVTANDYLEIKMKSGGVGYIADGAAIVARLGGKPIDLAFGPSTCSFGEELEGLFDKLRAKSRAEVQAIEDKDYPNDQARDAAMANLGEERSIYERMQRSWNGLTITAIGQHYESQSVYFAEAPAKVLEVFRGKGFNIDRQGNFPSSELYAGISATRDESAAYGKTDLGCGV